VDTVPLALFEHLDLSFLEEFPVFAPDPWGRTREHEAPELFKGVLYCFSRDIYGVKPVARELHDEVIWRQCRFESEPSYQSIHRFFTDFVLVAEDAFKQFSVTTDADPDRIEWAFEMIKDRRGATVEDPEYNQFIANTRKGTARYTYSVIKNDGSTEVTVEVWGYGEAPSVLREFLKEELEHAI
jgi:hypothetical protein